MKSIRASHSALTATLVLAATAAAASGETAPAPPSIATATTVGPADRAQVDTQVDTLPRVTAAPHEASGLVVPREGEAAWRGAARVALLPVRAAWSLTMAGPRAGLYAADRHQVGARLHDLFYNDRGTFGLFPTIGIETGFGANVGARLVATELFGAGASFSARAGYGGTYAHVAEATLSSGDLLGRRVDSELSAGVEAFSRSRYFGRGNIDDAVATRYRHDDVTVALTNTSRLTRTLALRSRATYRRARFDGKVDTRGEPATTDVYDRGELTGIDGLDTWMNDLELSWDNRQRPYFAQPSAAPSSGWLARVHVGWNRELGDGPSPYTRWGADVTRLFDLGNGRRVLTLRGTVASINGAYEEVPFIDLASLGGPHVLRGYTRDRFRDLSAATASAEYGWAAEQNLHAFLFVDAGRVGEGLADAVDDDLDTLRLGFGGGVQLHSNHGFLGRLVLASSIDGGLQLSLALSPAADVRLREEP